MIRKCSNALFCLVVILCCVSAVVAQERKSPDYGRSRRRHAERRAGDYRRHHRHDIGTAYRRAGRSAKRGGAGFGKNVVHGRPLRASKRLGTGMVGFGKHSGIGTARVGRRVGKGIKRVVRQ